MGRIGRLERLERLEKDLSRLISHFSFLVSSSMERGKRKETLPFTLHWKPFII